MQLSYAVLSINFIYVLIYLLIGYVIEETLCVPYYCVTADRSSVVILVELVGGGDCGR